MSGVNKAIIIGRLGQDPEVRYMPNGNAVANFTVATSESWKDQQGQKQDRVEWHKITIYGKLAEIAGKYLHKGSNIYLEGRIQTREWTDQQGIKRYTTEIICNEMQMLDSKQQQSQQQQPQQPAQTRQQQAQNNYAQMQSAPPPMDFDDDIPF